MTDEFMMRNAVVAEMYPANQAANVPFDLKLSGLLTDREFWNLLVVRRTWTGNRRVSLEELRKILHRIQAILDIED
jgi:hypothetical protein